MRNFSHIHRDSACPVDIQCAALHNRCMERARERTRANVAQTLKRARGYALLTQDQLARELGVSRRAIAAYEADENEPPAGVVLEWLAACGRPVADLEPAAAHVARARASEDETVLDPNERWVLAGDAVRSRCDSRGARRVRPSAMTAVAA